MKDTVLGFQNVIQSALAGMQGMCERLSDANLTIDALSSRVEALELICKMLSSRLECVEVDWATRPVNGEVVFDSGHFGQSDCTVRMGSSFDVAPAPKSNSKSRSQRRLARQAAEHKAHDSKASNSCLFPAGLPALDSPSAAASVLDSASLRVLLSFEQ